MFHSCTSQKLVPIENAKVFQLTKGKNEMTKILEGEEIGNMKWFKDSLCNAVYTHGSDSYCFQEIKKPKRHVEIKKGENLVASIEGINKHNSLLVFEGDTVMLRPVKAQIVAFHNEQQIARIKRNKKELTLEISPKYQENQVLISALIYKDEEWRKSNELSSDDSLLFLILIM